MCVFNPSLFTARGRGIVRAVQIELFTFYSTEFLIKYSKDAESSCKLIKMKAMLLLYSSGE